LANNELGQYDFIVAVAIWYEVLYAANLVSKQMQEKDMLIDVAIKKVKGLISFFEGYRETGFLQALESAKEIAVEMDIGTTFTKKRKITRKRHHDENPEAGPSLGTCNVCDGTGPPLFRGLQIYIEYIYVYMYCLVNKNVQQ